MRRKGNTFQITQFTIVADHVHPETTLVISEDDESNASVNSRRSNGILSVRVKDRSISKEGFHRVLSTVIEVHRERLHTTDEAVSNGPSAATVVMDEVFPESVFLDQYELDELLRVNRQKHMQGDQAFDTYFETRIWNENGVDVEKPVMVSPIVYSTFVTNGTWTRAENGRTEFLSVRFTVPIHFRYQAPSDGDNEFSTVHLHSPIAISVLDDGETTERATVVKLENNFPILEIKIPRGQLQDTEHVKLVTVIVTVFGSLLVVLVTLFTVLRSNARSTVNRMEEKKNQ